MHILNVEMRGDRKGDRANMTGEPENKSLTLQFLW